MIVPLRLAILLARITPSELTTVSSNAFALFAVINTLPPSAVIVPEFSAEALTAARSNGSLISPSPIMSTVTPSPAAIATVPRRALMTPLLATCGPIRAL